MKNIERIHQELRKLRDDLAAGRIEHDYPEAYAARSELKSINMRTVHCGSVGCLIGWINFRAGEKLISVFDYMSTTWLWLFCINRSSNIPVVMTISEIQPKQIVKAIDNYFKGAEDPWKGVFK